MKNLVITFLLINLTYLSQGQDIIYTVSCEKDGAYTRLDSIKFENLSNDTHIIFEALPDHESYNVNLSQEILEGSTRVTTLNKKDQIFDLLKNTPGEICIQCNAKISEEINLTISNVNGQLIFNKRLKTDAFRNTINVKIPNAGIYILTLNSTLGEASFKAIGSGSSGTVSTFINDYNSSNRKIITLKSVSENQESDFTFQKDDSLKVVAYLDGNSTYPITFKVNESDTLNLFFVEENENYMIVNNSKHQLNLGYHVWGNAADCGYGNDGSNVFLHGLYLTTDITYGFYEGIQQYLPYGKGNVLIFNMLNRDSVLVSGEYRFIDHVDCYGVVTDGDNTYQMTDADNFVRRKPHVDFTCYAIDVDIEVDWENLDPDNPSDEFMEKWTNYTNSWVEIKEGLVTIEKNEETFTITIDCIDINGLKIIGRYSGELNWILFDV